MLKSHGYKIASNWKWRESIEDKAFGLREATQRLIWYTEQEQSQESPRNSEPRVSTEYHQVCPQNKQNIENGIIFIFIYLHIFQPFYNDHKLHL